MPAKPLTDDVIHILQAAFLSGFVGWPDAIQVKAVQTLDRITPEQWPLEWALPIWLGEAWGLAPEAGQELAVCNLYGLVYIRLQDDLHEGVVPADAWPTVLGFANTAYQQAMARYAGLFAGHPIFWSTLDELMSCWLRAQLSSNEPLPTPFAQWQHADFMRLAERGAPLHIGGMGVGLLTARTDLLPALRMTIDYALVASVLLDHIQDWQEDLVAGRYNAFVAYASPLAQTPERAMANRQCILETLYRGNAAHPYFDIIQHYLAKASTTARQTRCPVLSDHLIHFRDEVENYALAMKQQLDERYRSAIATALGNSTFLQTLPIS